MQDEIIQIPDGKGGFFKCCKSQLWKTYGKNPFTGETVFPEMAKKV